jgi:23S rRNA pseudouridine2604 synthase
MDTTARTVRINKYLADHKYCTRREADELITSGRVRINGRAAVLGDKVSAQDVVEVRMRPRTFRYFAYHKPAGVITHSPQGGEMDIAQASGLSSVFPVGRLDKDSSGLIILTDDGRLTDALLNPEHEHDKEYEVTVSAALPKNFKRRMERGLDIGGYRTKPCTVSLVGDKKFRITLTEGKKHQIRRMCGALGQGVVSLKRMRIMNIKLGTLPAGEYRALKGAELQEFLSALALG